MTTRKPRKIKAENELDQTKLPVTVEAHIAALWSDNVVASQLTRTVARALLKQNVSDEKIIEQIRSAGRVVD